MGSPWRVEAVKLDTGSKSVEVKVGYEAGTLWASEAGARLPVYDSCGTVLAALGHVRV